MHSLEYLWYGIGAYLREQPDIKYLFGPVSISNAYPQQAKELIISFYQQQFGACTANKSQNTVCYLRAKPAVFAS